MALVWKDERYATGLREVDDQHREMFRLVEDKVCGWLQKHLMAIDLVLHRYAD